MSLENLQNVGEADCPICESLIEIEFTPQGGQGYEIGRTQRHCACKLSDEQIDLVREQAMAFWYGMGCQI